MMSNVSGQVILHSTYFFVNDPTRKVPGMLLTVTFCIICDVKRAYAFGLVFDLTCAVYRNTEIYKLLSVSGVVSYVLIFMVKES